MGRNTRFTICTIRSKNHHEAEGGLNFQQILSSVYILEMSFQSIELNALSAPRKHVPLSL